MKRILQLFGLFLGGPFLIFGMLLGFIWHAFYAGFDMPAQVAKKLEIAKNLKRDIGDLESWAHAHQ